MTINPANLSAQLRYRAAGNPPSTVADSAISNCYPGLEFDFRNVFRRVLEGIVLHEADNYVVEAFPPYKELVNNRLLSIDGHRTTTHLSGPQMPQGPSSPLVTSDNPLAIVAMEWSNVLAHVLATKAGKTVVCEFTAKDAPLPAKGAPRV